MHNNWREGSLNLATLEVDRFAGYAPRDMNDLAYLETSPLPLTGEPLRINAEVERGGSIRAKLLDEAGGDISGFALVDCLPVTRGGTSCELHWRNSDMAELKWQNGAHRFRLGTGDAVRPQRSCAPGIRLSVIGATSPA